MLTDIPRRTPSGGGPWLEGAIVGDIVAEFCRDGEETRLL